MDKDELKAKDFTILWDNVLVSPIRVTERDGIVLPRQEEDKSELGIVISIGLGIDDNIMQVGDTVLYNKYSTTKTDLGEDLIVRAEDIVAVLVKKKKK